MVTFRSYLKLSSLPVYSLSKQEDGWVVRAAVEVQVQCPCQVVKKVKARAVRQLLTNTQLCLNLECPEVSEPHPERVEVTVLFRVESSRTSRSRLMMTLFE